MSENIVCAVWEDGGGQLEVDQEHGDGQLDVDEEGQDDGDEDGGNNEDLVDVVDDSAQVGLEVRRGERLKVGQGRGGDVPGHRDQSSDCQVFPDICKYDPKAKYKTLCDRPLPLQLAFAILDNTSQLLVLLRHCN